MMLTMIYSNEPCMGFCKLHCLDIQLSRPYLKICRGELGDLGTDGKVLQYSKDFKGMEWGV
jgi:hypothetical protein